MSVFAEAGVFLVDAEVGEAGVVEVADVAVGIGVVFDDGVGEDDAGRIINELACGREAEVAHALDGGLDLGHGEGGSFNDAWEAVLGEVFEMLGDESSDDGPSFAVGRIAVADGASLVDDGIDLDEEALACVACGDTGRFEEELDGLEGAFDLLDGGAGGAGGKAVDDGGERFAEVAIIVDEADELFAQWAEFFIDFDQAPLLAELLLERGRSRGGVVEREGLGIDIAAG